MIDLEEDVPSKDQPRGNTDSKTDLRRQASSRIMDNTLRAVLVKKEETSAKGDERRRHEKEE
jgi:hypothetical protein